MHSLHEESVFEESYQEAENDSLMSRKVTKTNYALMATFGEEEVDNVTGQTLWGLKLLAFAIVFQGQVQEIGGDSCQANVRVGILRKVIVTSYHMKVLETKLRCVARPGIFV